MPRQYRSDDTSVWPHGRGSGKDGSKTFATETLSQAMAGAVGTSGATALSLSDASTFVNNDLVIIIQMRLSSGITVENYEFNRIASGGGTTSLTMAYPLQRDYNNTSPQRAQIVAFKEYLDVTIPAGVTLSLPDWDGNTKGGGVICAQNTITVAGTIDGEGKGFRGGTGGSGATEICDTGDTGESTIGDRIAGGSTSYGASPSPANSTNGSAGQGAQGKRATDGAAGGGGGGHANSGTNGEVSNGGANPVLPGGTGGTSVGNAGLTIMVMGGGGGGGGKAKDPNGQGGGNGGDSGAWLILIYKTLTVTGRINLDGADGQNELGGTGGGGGGGSGGAFRGIGQSASIGSNLITANGGTGGVGGDSVSNGNGGPGSDGRIHFDYLVPNGITGTTSPTYDSRQDTSLGSKVTSSSFLL